MENQEIINKLNNIKKGRFISLKKKKDLGKGIVKVSDLVIRLGVDYSNMKASEGKEVGSLPWGNWVKGLEGLVIENKNSYYLRVASAYSNNNKSSYYLNGEEISKEEVAKIVGEKKLVSNNPDVYNIKFENILALGAD